ncbi:MAG TPA: hypothetical protein VNX86_04715 [Rhizomicrobium sp.]|nr:hypothetical protein [Rhizomicrobium sp.]
MRASSLAEGGGGGPRSGGGGSKRSAPAHVAILALGPSLEAYVDHVKRLGSRHAFADEVWGINAVADVITCDRVFHMDDVRIQEIRARAAPGSNIAAMLTWLKKHPGPVYTSRPHTDYPGLVAYPLAEVMTATGGIAYFNNTAAYAVAYAIAIGVRKMSLFGMDFTYPNAHDAEKGRACVEFYLGVAKMRGIVIGLPANSTLLDGIATQPERLYGYDTLDVGFREERGKLSTVFTVKDELPTAEQIERRYDHSRHPNRIVAAATEKRT